MAVSTTSGLGRFMILSRLESDRRLACTVADRHLDLETDDFEMCLRRVKYCARAWAKIDNRPRPAAYSI